MDNEELIYSFMEISNLPIEDARKFLQEANFQLELALQNYYDSQQSSSSSQTQPATAAPAIPNQFEEEVVREPIPREFNILVEDDVRLSRLSRVRQQFSSSFRDFKREMEIQEELATGGAQSAKRKCLEDIYRHPIDIIANIEFNYAKIQAQQVGKWVAVLINNESLESLSFNRDIFNEPSQKVKQILRKNFIFLRKNSNDHEGIRIMQIYNLVDSPVPIFLLIDSLTGELKKNFGDCTKLTLKTVVRELKKYTSSSTDRQLVYNSAYEDSDDDDSNGALSNGFSQIASTSGSKAASTSNVQLPQQKPETAVTKNYVESDEESFASLNSNDISGTDDEECKDNQEESEEAKVLDSDDEILKNDDGLQTNVMLRMEDENHKFKYPSSRTVANLISYIYRNYLLQTGIYDNKTKRFSLFSKIHSKCLTMLDQEKSLQEANIHPSIVLLHRTIDKDE